jgi:hypothetical protein
MKIIIALVFCLGMLPSAYATIIDNGSFTTDTATGLDWLDITATLNQSYDQVTAQLGSGGSLQGWRYATGVEFNSLVSDYLGLSVVPDGVTALPGTLAGWSNIWVTPSISLATVANILTAFSVI